MMKRIKLLSVYSRRETDLPVDVYESMTEFIISMLQEHDEIYFQTLLDAALENKTIKFENNLGWCLLQVKRDLEARGVIQVKIKGRGTNSQRIKLRRKGRSILRSSFLS